MSTNRVGQPDHPQRRRWALPVWWLSIVLTAPLGRPIVEGLRERNLLRLAVGGAIAAAALAIAAAMGRGVRQRRDRRAWLVVAAVLLTGALTVFIQRPEERWHIVQFGVLGALLYRALRWRRRGLLLALAVAAAAGWLDELWQAVLPGRVYDLHDVLLNVGAGVLGVAIAGLAYANRPSVGEPPRAMASP